MSEYNPLFNYCKGIDHEYIKKYRKTNETKLSVDDTIIRIKNFIDRNNVENGDLEVLEMILDDNEILEKAIFVSDGSYMNNRIYYRKHEYRSRAIDITLKNHSSKIKIDNEDSMSNKDKLEYIKSHYESIFIHLTSDYDSYMISFCHDYEL